MWSVYVIEGRRGLSKIVLIAIVSVIAARRIYIILEPFTESSLWLLVGVVVLFIAFMFVGVNTFRILVRLWKS